MCPCLSLFLRRLVTEEFEYDGGEAEAAALGAEEAKRVEETEEDATEICGSVVKARRAAEKRAAEENE